VLDAHTLCYSAFRDLRDVLVAAIGAIVSAAVVALTRLARDVAGRGAHAQ